MDEHIPPIETEEEYKEILAVIRKHDGEIDYKTLNHLKCIYISFKLYAQANLATCTRSGETMSPLLH